MGRFAALAGQAFARVADVMGVSAVWLSSSGTETPGTVLFRNPTEPMPIGGAERYEYRPNEATAEFHATTFPGLKKAVDSGGDELLRIGAGTYFINEVTTRADGLTVVAHITPHKNED